MKRFSVVVGNIGLVYSGDNEEIAIHEFRVYKAKSRRGEGRSANEEVTLMDFNDVRMEYSPDKEAP